MTSMQAAPIKTGGIEIPSAGDYHISRRRHVSSSMPRSNSLSETDSNDEYTTTSETEPEARPQVQRRLRKRRDYDTRERRRRRSSKPGALSHLLQFLSSTITRLIILPLINILGTVLFYILSTLVIIILGYCTLRSLPILLPKLLAFLLPHMSLPGALQRSIHGVSRFSTALGNTYCSVVEIGCSMWKQTDEEVIGNITYTATGQVRQASKVITSLNNLDETGSSLALDSVLHPALYNSPPPIYLPFPCSIYFPSSVSIRSQPASLISSTQWSCFPLQHVVGTFLFYFVVLY